MLASRMRAAGSARPRPSGPIRIPPMISSTICGTRGPGSSATISGASAATTPTTTSVFSTLARSSMFPPRSRTLATSGPDGLATRSAPRPVRRGIRALGSGTNPSCRSVHSAETIESAVLGCGWSTGRRHVQMMLTASSRIRHAHLVRRRRTRADSSPVPPEQVMRDRPRASTVVMHTRSSREPTARGGRLDFGMLLLGMILFGMLDRFRRAAHRRQVGEGCRLGTRACGRHRRLLHRRAPHQPDFGRRLGIPTEWNLGSLVGAIIVTLAWQWWRARRAEPKR